MEQLDIIRCTKCKNLHIFFAPNAQMAWRENYIYIPIHILAIAKLAAELVLNVSALELAFQVQQVHHLHEQLRPLAIQDFLYVVVVVVMHVAPHISMEPQLVVLGPLVLVVLVDIGNPLVD
jgi:hypothetical protein